VAACEEDGVGDGRSGDACNGDGGGRRRHDAADCGTGRRYATNGLGVGARVAGRVAASLGVDGALSRESRGRSEASHPKNVAFQRDGKHTAASFRHLGPPHYQTFPTTPTAPRAQFPPLLCAPLPRFYSGPILSEALPSYNRRVCAIRKTRAPVPFGLQSHHETDVKGPQ